MNEQYYKNIINAFPYAILILDKGLKVRECNKCCEILLSKVAEEVLGRDLSEIISHRDLQNQIISVLQSGGTKFVELHINAENPQILKAVITAIGEDFCMVTLEDISERARLEEQLVQSEKLAGMGLLAASVAHELGNPLSIISSTLRYILEDPANKNNRQLVEMIERIMDNIERMHELLRSLSDFTSSQRPRFELTDFRHLLFQMLAFVHKEAESRKIKVTYNFDKNLPDCQLDSGEIKQMLLNLLKNAIEAMPSGGELQMKAHLLKEKDSVYIEISDTGCGIREEDLRSIFRPFYTTKPKGTGLGLPFCRRVVEEHGGEIQVKSQWGKGSTFSIILPIRIRPEE